MSPGEPFDLSGLCAGACLALLSLWQSPGAASPHIEARAGEPVLVLPDAMVAALRRFDHDFTIRRLIDYPPYMWRPGCTWSPECARSLYRLEPHEAPFAAIGDFNGDGILDVVMDGDNRVHGRRIVLLSNQHAFSVSEVDSPAHVRNSIETSRTSNGATRDWEDGVDVGLSLAKPGTYRTSYEPQALVLTRDGFVVSYFEKAAVLYYLRNGKWNQFTLSD